MRMRWLVMTLLLLPACSMSEGQNVVQTPEDGTEPVETDGTVLEEVEGEVEEPRDPGPPFDNTLGWKVLDSGEDVAWNVLYGIYNSATDWRFYAGGAMGTVVWYDGPKAKWHHLDIASSSEVRGIWAAANDYVVVCGEAGLLKRYYDFAGSGKPEWYHDDIDLQTLAEFEAVSGYDKDHFWAVAKEGIIYQYKEGNWKLWKTQDIGLIQLPPDLYAVSALGPTKAAFAGDEMVIFQDGDTFTWNKSDFIGYKLRSLAVSGGNTYWMGGDKGAIFKLAGGKVEKHQPDSYSHFSALWVAADGNVYAAGGKTSAIVWKYDGNAQDEWDFLAVESPKFINDEFPERIPSQLRLSGIWGIGADNLFVTTKEKLIIQYAVHP
jgi:hypothetical protein